MCSGCVGLHHLRLLHVAPADVAVGRLRVVAPLVLQRLEVVAVDLVVHLAAVGDWKAVLQELVARVRAMRQHAEPGATAVLEDLRGGGLDGVGVHGAVLHFALPVRKVPAHDVWRLGVALEGEEELELENAEELVHLLRAVEHLLRADPELGEVPVVAAHVGVIVVTHVDEWQQKQAVRVHLVPGVLAASELRPNARVLALYPPTPHVDAHALVMYPADRALAMVRRAELHPEVFVVTVGKFKEVSVKSVARVRGLVRHLDAPVEILLVPDHALSGDDPMLRLAPLAAVHRKLGAVRERGRQAHRGVQRPDDGAAVEHRGLVGDGVAATCPATRTVVDGAALRVRERGMRGPRAVAVAAGAVRPHASDPEVRRLLLESLLILGIGMISPRTDVVVEPHRQTATGDANRDAHTLQADRRAPRRRRRRRRPLGPQRPEGEVAPRGGAWREAGTLRLGAVGYQARRL
mmetsp:Transcript_9061/g.23511  ORF Transcript_9061/g.23511 Transcript_9061/m.23511 type:complete len:464 (-) Transcript_9061:91-1482(-)